MQIEVARTVLGESENGAMYRVIVGAHYELFHDRDSMWRYILGLVNAQSSDYSPGERLTFAEGYAAALGDWDFDAEHVSSALAIEGVEL